MIDVQGKQSEACLRVINLPGLSLDFLQYYSFHVS